MKHAPVYHSALYEVKVKEFQHSVISDMAIVTTNLPLREPTFWHGGITYIVAGQWSEKGLFRAELIPIKAITTMHVHEYRLGICRLCGHRKEGEVKQ